MSMIRLRVLAVTAAVALLATTASPKAAAQVSFGVQIGPAPVCPYGYFDTPPYGCAPYGYYGPEWFPNGVFIGAGPWFRGPAGFRGPVNRRFDPRFGFRGPLPQRGSRPTHSMRGMHGFRGNAWRDGRGHSVSGRR